MRKSSFYGLIVLFGIPLAASGQATAPGAGQPAAPAPPVRPAQPSRAPTPVPVPVPAPAAPAPIAPSTTLPVESPTTVPTDRALAAMEGAMAPSPSPFSGLTAQPGTFGTLAGVSSGGVPQMIGDLSPLPRLQAAQAGLPPPFPPPRPPGVPRPTVGTMLVPSIRAVKISENQSPFPQDRVYFTFNYFDNVNGSVNQRLHAPVGSVQVFREIFGFEKTFNDGQGSIGLRLPLDTLSAASRAPAAYGTFGGSSTAVGDLSVILKYILLRDPESGSALSGGLDVTAPTGPGRFAGFSTFRGGPHTTTLQPFLGYWINGGGNWYLHGFTVVDVPMTQRDVTMIYNDVGLGYFLRRGTPESGFDRLVTMIVPTFEVHINDPLNHRNAFNAADPAATPDMVNLTYGLTLGFNQNTFLTTALVTPVTGPRPFELEAMAFVNVFFGRTARQLPAAPLVLGGP